MNSRDDLRRMVAHGVTRAQLCHVMLEDGLSDIEVVKNLRELFGLSMSDAKGVLVQALKGQELADHQAKLADGLEQALHEYETDSSDGNTHPQ